MLELGLAVLGWLNYWFNAKEAEIELTRLQPLAWQETPVFAIAAQPDEKTETIVEQYLEQLEARGIALQRQGLLIRSDWLELAAHRSTEPAPAASLTKLATSLTALAQWGAQHQFTTEVYTVGELDSEGVLGGDLIIKGSGDPLFVWQEAIAVGDALQQLGIRQVAGDLVVVDRFWMNYNTDGVQSGKLLRQALHRNLWSNQVVEQYQNLPQPLEQPQISIDGDVRVETQLPASAHLRLRHQSLPLFAILQQMNIYSNNNIAQILADLTGGADTVAASAAAAAGVPLAEIQLINGSGLGVENRISPRAAVAMLMAIEDLLAPQLSVRDLLPVSGRGQDQLQFGDRPSTLRDRNIPPGTAIKTGSLWQVSALAGVITTAEQGSLWFAIINHGNGGILEFRREQDQLLGQLSQNWQLADVQETPTVAVFGDPQRNWVVEEFN